MVAQDVEVAPDEPVRGCEVVGHVAPRLRPGLVPCSGTAGGRTLVAGTEARWTHVPRRRSGRLVPGAAPHRGPHPSARRAPRDPCDEIGSAEQTRRRPPLPPAGPRSPTGATTAAGHTGTAPTEPESRSTRRCPRAEHVPDTHPRPRGSLLNRNAEPDDRPPHRHAPHRRARRVTDGRRRDAHLRCRDPREP
ncbi:hypothetical protein FTX61_13925 [Nitriliruptoraceae bacterium ZYF776]|nr:hypothetical protein [Profundirhabdus halotolerans]